MKSTLIAFSLVTASVAAFAGPGASAESAAPSASGQITRAAVQADLQTALQRGEVFHGDLDTTARASHSPGAKTRAKVKAELAAAIARGELTHGEVAYNEPRSGDTSRTRAQVIAETLEAIQMGQLHPPGALNGGTL